MRIITLKIITEKLQSQHIENCLIDFSCQGKNDSENQMVYSK